MTKQLRPHWRASKQMQTRARELRGEMTPAEKKLWYHISNNQLGVQFRKQYAVGPYIVDFFCAKAKLVIEVDGDVHGDPEHIKYDVERTQWLNEQKNYRVVRFWNNDVLHNVDSVLTMLSELIGKS